LREKGEIDLSFEEGEGLFSCGEDIT